MKFFKGNDYKYKGKDIAKVEIYYSDSDIIASRTALGPDFTRKKILSVTDTGIQKILLRHLSKYDECEGDNIKENPGMAFSPEGIMTMNRNISELNNGKFHHPIYKVRCSEPLGCKFVVGSEGNKKTKYVEAASGTNLFYAVYTDEEGNRQYESIPLNVVVERCRQGEKVYDKSKYFTDKNGSKKVVPIKIVFTCRIQSRFLLSIKSNLRR